MANQIMRQKMPGPCDVAPSFLQFGRWLLAALARSKPVCLNRYADLAGTRCSAKNLYQIGL
jgi:hypothetical protein